jgi:hypothetical protein
MVPALQRRVLDRAHAFALIKWGPRASEYGWEVPDEPPDEARDEPRT